MKKIKVGVIGSTGRMGREIFEVVQTNKRFEAFAGVAKDPENCPYKHSTQNLEFAEADQVDLWVDFSSPEALMQQLPKLVKLKRPVLSGTTGLSEEQFKKLEGAAKKIPVFWASNMSLGIAVLSKAIETLSVLNGFEFQVEEIHHKHKKDSPSGTAITLNKKLTSVTRQKIPNPVSIRGGGVFGVHKIFAMGEEEIITFEHTALNRRVFARGVLWAAERLLKKPAGYYTMADFLK